MRHCTRGLDNTWRTFAVGGLVVWLYACQLQELTDAAVDPTSTSTQQEGSGSQATPPTSTVPSMTAPAGPGFTSPAVASGFQTAAEGTPVNVPGVAVALGSDAGMACGMCGTDNAPPGAADGLQPPGGGLPAPTPSAQGLSPSSGIDMGAVTETPGQAGFPFGPGEWMEGDCPATCQQVDADGPTCSATVEGECLVDCTQCPQDTACNPLLPGALCPPCRQGDEAILTGDYQYGQSFALSEERGLITTYDERLMGAREITGNLDVQLGMGAMWNLSFLSCLERVGGDLTITLTPPASPGALQGLHALQEVGGDLRITGAAGRVSASAQGSSPVPLLPPTADPGALPEPTPTTGLTPSTGSAGLPDPSPEGAVFPADLSALSQLKRVGGRLSLHKTGVMDLTGLSNLEEVHGLSVDTAPLVSLEGMDKLAAIRGSIELRETPVQSLMPLAGITGIADVQLIGLPALASLGGLSLGTDLEALRLVRLPQVTDFSALEPVQRVNTSLNLVALPAMDRWPLPALQTVGAELRLSELPLTSLGGLKLQGFSGSLLLRDLPRLQALDLPGLSRDLQDVILLDLPELVSLSGLAGLQSASTLALYDLPQLASLSGLEALQRLIQLELRKLPQLASLASLSNLTTVASLELSELGQLQSLTGLESLQAIALGTAQTDDGRQGRQGWQGWLVIAQNPVLQDVAGLRSLAQLQGHLLVSHNPQLAQCQVLDLSVRLGTPCGCAPLRTSDNASTTSASECSCDILCGCTGNLNNGPVCL